jgi:hypothetical protein
MKLKEAPMSVEKVMEILNEFEVQAARDIVLDREIKVDPYESVGRHILIRKIKKRINHLRESNKQEVS